MLASVFSVCKGKPPLHPNCRAPAIGRMHVIPRWRSAPAPSPDSFGLWPPRRRRPQAAARTAAAIPIARPAPSRTAANSPTAPKIRPSRSSASLRFQIRTFANPLYSIRPRVSGRRDAVMKLSYAMCHSQEGVENKITAGGAILDCVCDQCDGFHCRVEFEQVPFIRGSHKGIHRGIVPRRSALHARPQQLRLQSPRNPEFDSLKCVWRSRAQPHGLLI